MPNKDHTQENSDKHLKLVNQHSVCDKENDIVYYRSKLELLVQCRLLQKPMENRM
jgi:hypothetical protein